MLDCFGDVFFVSPSMVWTSIFDKLSPYAFYRPWVGHIEYLFVHGLDGAQILCPRFLSRLIFGRVYLVNKGHAGVSPLSSREFSCPWNVEHLRRYYQ